MSMIYYRVMKRMRGMPTIKKTLTEAGYLGFFLLLSALYFREGVFGDAVLASTGDAIQLFYPLESVLGNILGYGELPLWNPYFFGGMPLMAAHQVAALNPVTAALAFMFDTRLAFNFDLAVHYALAGYFAFLYFRGLTGRVLPSLAGGVAAGLMGYLHYNPDHVSIVRAAPWLPLALWLVDRLIKKPSPGRAAQLSMALSMFILSGNGQIGFYSITLTAAYMAFRLHCAGGGCERRRLLRRLALSVGLAVLIALPQLVATTELESLSVRQGLTYTQFSNGSLYPYRLAGLFFPGIYDKTYFFSFGAFTMFMGLGAALRNIRSDRHGGAVRFWAAAALVAVLLALGDFTPLHKLMHHMPVYNLFRVPHRLWFIVHLAWSLLTALGLKEVLSGEGNSRRWYAHWMLGSLCVLVLAPWGLGLMPNDLVAEGSEPGRLTYADPSVIWPLALCALGTGCILMLRRFSSRPAAPALIVCIITSLLVAEGFYYRPDIGKWDLHARGVALEHPENYLKFLRREAGNGRVALYAHFHETMGVSVGAPMLHGVRILGGYEQLTPEGYNSLLQMGRIGNIKSSLTPLLADNKVLSMLASRLVVLCGRHFEVFNDMTDSPYRLLWETHRGMCGTYLNRHALERARPALRVLAAGKDSGYEMLMSSGVSLERDVLLDESALKELEAERGKKEFSEGFVQIMAETASTVRLFTEFPGTGFVVLADQYYPGWHAYVDGKETSLYRANLVQRGVVVPAGRHEVLFIYRPVHILAALWVSGITVFFCTLASLAGLRRGAP
jgi:hypothetical protein